jgi:hypothetical protein
LQQLPNEEAMELNWHLPEDADGDQLVLERSLDQYSFTQVEDFGKITTPGADVTYIDRDALAGMQYYYRMRDIDPNGELKYSPVIAAKFGQAGDYHAGNVYPNPARDHFSLDFTAFVEGDLHMQLFDGAGRMVFAENKEMEIGQPSPYYTMPEGLPTGVYQARFTFSGQSFSQKVIVADVN